MPFDMHLDESTLRAMAAVRSMRETSKANGNDEMTLDEINQEIAAARQARKTK